MKYPSDSFNAAVVDGFYKMTTDWIIANLVLEQTCNSHRSQGNNKILKILFHKNRRSTISDGVHFLIIKPVCNYCSLDMRDVGQLRAILSLTTSVTKSQQMWWGWFVNREFDMLSITINKWTDDNHNTIETIIFTSILIFYIIVSK